MHSSQGGSGIVVDRHGDDREFIAGEPVKWHTGSSPLQMSSQQIVMNGGSCTGTAILLAAVLRSVGIPARVTGCSTELPDNDNDHHWVEFCPSLPPPLCRVASLRDHRSVSSDDSEDPGPFGDHWHTKEGVSKGVSAAYSSLCVFAELQRSCCAQNAGGPWDGASGPMNGCMKGLKAKSPLDMIWSASWSVSCHDIAGIWVAFFSRCQRYRW